MKKYLSIICALLMLTTLTSCGNSTSSSDSSEVSKSIVLDSVFENDYLKIAVNDDWEEENRTNYTEWEFENRDFIRLTISEDNSGKLSLKDFISAYENNDRYAISKYMPEFDCEEDNLIDGFEKNNQTYIVTESGKIHYIFFKNDIIFGYFTHSATEEEVVMDMIDSIEFKTIETKTETTTKRKIKKNTYTTKSKESTEKVTQPVTEPPTEKVPETQPPVIETSPVQTTLHFILNLETNCIHIDPRCSAAQKILPENYSEIDIAETDLSSYRDFYWACGKCSKEYKQILPKIE